MRKLTPTPYTKRTAGRVAATPALQNTPVGLASCTTQPDARRLLEYPHLAVASAYCTRARTPFAPSTSSDTSSADVKSFTEADCHVSSNPHVHRTPATDSRRSAGPTPRMGQAKWRIPHMRFVRDVSHENARHFDAKGIQRVYRSSSSRTGTRSNWKLKTYGICFKTSWSYSLFCLGITYLGLESKSPGHTPVCDRSRSEVGNSSHVFYRKPLTMHAGQGRRRILGDKHCKLPAGRPVFS